MVVSVLAVFGNLILLLFSSFSHMPSTLDQFLTALSHDQDFLEHPGTFFFRFYNWINVSYQEAPYHTVVEIILIIFVFRLLFQKRKAKKKASISKSEKETLLAKWDPEPLAPNLPPYQLYLSSRNSEILDSSIGPTINLVGHRNTCTQMCSFDYLSLAAHPDLKEASVQALQHYGTGSCGPRAFYGTMDIHESLERLIAEWVGSESSIVYSYGYATIASAIPAFVSSHDLLIVDEAVDNATLSGMKLSRADTRFFAHNNLENLEECLIQAVQEEYQRYRKSKFSLTRLIHDATFSPKNCPPWKLPQRNDPLLRFIIINGIYSNTGTIAPLDAIVELARRYKFRIILDDTHAIGTVGKDGLGILSHYNINNSDVAIRTFSFGAALGSIGGACVGSRKITDHQRIAGLGYCFSASIPPVCAAASIEGINLMRERPELRVNLKKNIFHLSNRLNSGILSVRSLGFQLSHSPESPIFILQLTPTVVDVIVNHPKDLQQYVTPPNQKYCQEVVEYRRRYIYTTLFLQKIVDACVARGVIITRVTVPFDQEEKAWKNLHIWKKKHPLCTMEDLVSNHLNRSQSARYLEPVLHPPRLRITVNAGHTIPQINASIDTFQKCVKALLDSHRK